MARHMAAYLQTTGRTLQVYNRTAAKCHALASEPNVCVQPVTSLPELAQKCDIIFTMLADDAGVRAVMEQLLGAAGRRVCVVVDSSTILPETTKELAETAAKAGVAHVTACVFGRPDAVVASRLVVACAGPQAAKERARPYLTPLLVKLIDLGELPQQANVMKLCGNFTIVSQIEMISQSLALAEKNGVSKEIMVDFISSFYPSIPIIGYSQRIAADAFDAGTGFSVELALKDVGHMRKLAQTSSMPLPMADMAFNHLLQARAMGHGASDWGAVSIAVRASAGMPTPPPSAPAPQQ